MITSRELDSPLLVRSSALTETEGYWSKIKSTLVQPGRCNAAKTISSYFLDSSLYVEDPADLIICIRDIASIRQAEGNCEIDILF